MNCLSMAAGLCGLATGSVCVSVSTCRTGGIGCKISPRANGKEQKEDKAHLGSPSPTPLTKSRVDPLTLTGVPGSFEGQGVGLGGGLPGRPPSHL